MNETQRYDFKLEKSDEIKNILKQVNIALKERGYNPTNQIVGYFMSGDPSYITTHNNARNLIKQYGRDEIIEVLVDNILNDEK